jgi:hypothetical protein
MNDVPIYLPATKTRPATPAPPLLTGPEVMRLLRIPRREDGYQVLYRLRQNGLQNIRVGNEVRYLLFDVMEYMRAQRDKATTFAAKSASNAPKAGRAKLTNRTEAQC